MARPNYRDEAFVVRTHDLGEADQIIVLDDGQIAGIGKHQDLMQTCGVYQQIALSQLSKEELA